MSDLTTAEWREIKDAAHAAGVEQGRREGGDYEALRAAVASVASQFEGRRDYVRSLPKARAMDRREANVWDVAATDLAAVLAKHPAVGGDGVGA